MKLPWYKTLGWGILFYGLVMPILFVMKLLHRGPYKKVAR